MTSDQIREVLSGHRTYPSTFRPTYSTPDDQFSKDHRFINKTDPREIMIYTDGACALNGANNPRGGCAIVYRPSAYTQTGELIHTGSFHFSLEDRGPTGHLYPHTSNRAELRAVIAALQFRNWSEDCNPSWRSLVIATDSEYVALNATTRAEMWENRGWINVKNQDLWKLLMTEIRRLHFHGVHVSFWRIGREFNGRADQWAKAFTHDPVSRKPFFTKYEADGQIDVRQTTYEYGYNQ